MNPPRRVPAAVVRFTKRPPDAGADAWTLIRPDDRSVEEDLPRTGVLAPRQLQWVVEHTLGWSDGYFGHQAAGNTAAASRSRRGRQARALAAALQQEQWGGTAEAETWARRVASAARKLKVPTPHLDAHEVAQLREAMRAFGAAWRPLAPGRSLEFPCPGKPPP